MYRLFRHSDNKGTRTSINHPGAEGEKPKKSNKDVHHDALVVVLVEEGADEEDQRHGGLNLAAAAPRRLRRSLSRDSFSTFTTAAETPDHGSLVISRSSHRVVFWEDGKVPFEISVPQQPSQKEGVGGAERTSKSLLLKARTRLTEPLLSGDDDEDDEVAKDVDFSNDMYLLSERINSSLEQEPEFSSRHPSKETSNESRPYHPSRERTGTLSSGDADYLRAPERFTRFEI
jgi:hypothetical protein